MPRARGEVGALSSQEHVPLALDGSHGEGGGQIVRTALALSVARVVSPPHAIAVTVRAGRVTLTGPILSSDDYPTGAEQMARIHERARLSAAWCASSRSTAAPAST